MGIDIGCLGPNAQRQVMQQLGMNNPKGTKYHNIPTKLIMPNGETHTFDSEKEARRYTTLFALLQTGEIRKLKLQPQFTLQESFISPEGDRIQAVKYIADFSYELRPQTPDCNQWIKVVEDVKSKGTRTKEYNIKRKMMAERGIIIKEV